MNGVLSPKAKGFLYLIIHDRVGTKQRGNRLMPRKYPSPHCTRCEISACESSQHRYQSCLKISEAWNWLYDILLMLDSTLAMVDEWSILRLDFPKSLRENAILWLIGNFIEIVEHEAVLRENKISCASLKGLLKQKKKEAQFSAMPELGIICGIDWDQQGVG